MYLLWLKKCSPLYSRVSRNVLREVATYLDDNPQLIYLAEDCQLISLNVKTQESTVLHVLSTFKTEDYCGYLLLEKKLIRCGGQEHFQGAYEVNLESFEVTALATLRHPRCYSPGMVFFQRQVYVFGSIGPDLRSAQEHTGEVLESTGWELLTGEMSGIRSYFSPCVFQGEIYLSGGGFTTEVDVCSEKHISRLGLRLPEKDCVAITNSSQLLFISEHSSTILRGPTSEHCTTVPFRLTTKAIPKVYRHNIYFVDCDTVRCVEISSSGAVVSCASFKVVGELGTSP